jgi:hypothetical protein
MTSLPSFARRGLAAGALAAASLSLGGCAVVTVASTAASIAVTGASLAVDAAVGTARVAGSVAGAAVNVVLPSGDK